MPRFHLLPATARPDARRLLVARALRGTVDGFVSVMLASYLHSAGYTPVEISAIVTGTLLGSAVLTLALGMIIWGVCLRWTQVTGGENGLRGDIRPAILMDWTVRA